MSDFILYGVTPAIGGSELAAAGCFTGTCSVTGATLGMPVQATPRTFPGNGTFWSAYVSAPNVVTVKLCNAEAGFVIASIFDVAVFNAAGAGPGGVTDVTGTPPINSTGGDTPDISVDTATTSSLGVVQPDGTTILVDGSGVISAPGSAGGVLFAEVTLTGADIAALATTPFEIVPAPGAGKMAVLLATSSDAAQFTEGTTPYQVFGSISIGYRYPPNIFIGGLNGFITSLLGTDAILWNALNVNNSGPGTKADVENQPINLVGNGFGGRIDASTISNPGSLYAPGDTGIINGGNSDALYEIDTVDGGGGVLTFHLTDPGTNYQTGIETTTPLTGIGSDFEIDVTAVESMIAGDGTLRISVPYRVFDLN